MLRMHKSIRPIYRFLGELCNVQHTQYVRDIERKSIRNVSFFNEFQKILLDSKNCLNAFFMVLILTVAQMKHFFFNKTVDYILESHLILHQTIIITV